MDRELEKMSLEELWQLFPIFLVEHNREWACWYDEEVKAIFSLVPEKYITRIIDSRPSVSIPKEFNVSLVILLRWKSVV